MNANDRKVLIVYLHFMGLLALAAIIGLLLVYFIG
jgi:hypothetical protein